MKKNIFKKVLATVASLAMVATMMPGLSMTAKAAADTVAKGDILSVAAAAVIDYTLTNATDTTDGATLSFTYASGADTYSIRNFDLSSALTAATLNTTNDGTNEIPIDIESSLSWELTNGFSVATLVGSQVDAVTTGDGKITLTFDAAALPKKYKAEVSAAPDGLTGLTAYEDAAGEYAYDDTDIAGGVGDGSDFMFSITPDGDVVIDENTKIRYSMSGSDTNYTDKVEKIGGKWVFTIAEVTGNIELIEVIGADEAATLNIKTGESKTDFSAKYEGRNATHDTKGVSKNITVKAGASVEIEAAAQKASNKEAEFIEWKFTNNTTDEVKLENVKTTSASTKIVEMPDILMAEALYGYKVTLPTGQPVKYYKNYGTDSQEEITEFYIYDKAEFSNKAGTKVDDLETEIVAIPDAGYAFEDAADAYFLDKDGSKLTTAAPVATTDKKGVVFTFAGDSIKGARKLESLNVLSGPHKVTFEAPEGVTFTNPGGSSTYEKEFTISRTDAEGGKDDFTFKVKIDESKFQTPINYTVSYTADGKTVEMVARTATDDATMTGSYIIEGLANVDKSLAGIVIKVEGLVPIASDNPFDDVTDPSNTFYDDIKWAKENGYAAGIGNNLFGMGQTLTRAQAVTFLHNYAGKPTGAADSGFVDITQAWQKPGVDWAKAENVTAGTSDTTFSPEDPVTRGQAMQFMYKTAKGTEGATSSFTDVPSGHSFYNAVSWGAENKLTVGYGDGNFGVNDPIKREHFIRFMRVMDNVINAE